MATTENKLKEKALQILADVKDAFEVIDEKYAMGGSAYTGTTYSQDLAPAIMGIPLGPSAKIQELQSASHTVTTEKESHEYTIIPSAAYEAMKKALIDIDVASEHVKVEIDLNNNETESNAYSKTNVIIPIEPWEKKTNYISDAAVCIINSMPASLKINKNLITSYAIPIVFKAENTNKTVLEIKLDDGKKYSIDDFMFAYIMTNFNEDALYCLNKLPSISCDAIDVTVDSDGNYEISDGNTYTYTFDTLASIHQMIYDIKDNYNGIILHLDDIFADLAVAVTDIEKRTSDVLPARDIFPKHYKRAKVTQYRIIYNINFSECIDKIAVKPLLPIRFNNENELTPFKDPSSSLMRFTFRNNLVEPLLYNADNDDLLHAAGLSEIVLEPVFGISILDLR